MSTFVIGKVRAKIRIMNEISKTISLDDWDKKVSYFYT